MGATKSSIISFLGSTRHGCPGNRQPSGRKGPEQSTFMRARSHNPGVFSSGCVRRSRSHEFRPSSKWSAQYAPSHACNDSFHHYISQNIPNLGEIEHPSVTTQKSLLATTVMGKLEPR